LNKPTITFPDKALKFWIKCLTSKYYSGKSRVTTPYMLVHA